MILLPCCFGRAPDSSSTELAEKGKEEKGNNSDNIINLPSLSLGSDSKNTQSIREIELKQAQLWAKIDELAGQIFEQNQRIRILEKSKTLGLTEKGLSVVTIIEKVNSFT